MSQINDDSQTFTVKNSKGRNVNITLVYLEHIHASEFRSTDGAYGFFCANHFRKAMTQTELEREVANIAAAL